MILLKIIYKKTERQQQKVSLVHLYLPLILKGP